MTAMTTSTSPTPGSKSPQAPAVPPRPPLARPLFIAEVKTQSPFGYVSPHSWDQLLDRAMQHTRYDNSGMVSIHTDPRWGGSFDLVLKARRRVPILTPILAKGIHPTDDDLRRVFDAGADYALCVRDQHHLPATDLIDRCLIESPTITDLAFSGESDTWRSLRMVWNARNLETGKPKAITGAGPHPFDHARSVWPGWLCQASMIRSWADVHPGANAILVGESLMDFPLP